MRRAFRTIPLPLMAALLLIGAGWRVTTAGNDSFSTALVTSAMILLGAWIREFVPGEVVLKEDLHKDDDVSE